jgi:hypothetical protein
MAGWLNNFILFLLNHMSFPIVIISLNFQANNYFI